MGAPALGLLKLLGSGILPLIRGGSPGAPERSDIADFQALLQLAQRGELVSGRAVNVDDGLSIELSESQLGRLSRAADAADAAGARKFLAIIDGLGVVIDVPNRRIEGAIELSGQEGAERLLPADVLVGIDSVAVVPEDDAGGVIPLDTAVRRIASPSGGGPLSRIENASLISNLSDARRVEGNE